MLRRLLAAAILSGLGASPAACASDRVLPDVELPAVCGDGVLETGET